MPDDLAPAPVPTPPTAVAASVLADALDAGVPDTGDLSTQLALEAALDAVTRALRALPAP